MLVLSRRIGEEIVIDGSIRVTVMQSAATEWASELSHLSLCAWTGMKCTCAAQQASRKLARG
jgi:hypothetical protein